MKSTKLIYLFIITAIILSSCRLANPNEYEVKAGGQLNLSQCDESAFAGKSLSYFSLKKRHSKKQFVSHVDIVNSLPKEYRRHFVLLHDSVPAKVTPKAPRVVFYGSKDEPSFILAASESTKNKNIEIIEFNKGVFCFRDIRISNSGNISFTDNPPSCRGCHGFDQRPNWEAQGVWPGAYGSAGGQISVPSSEWMQFSDFYKSNSNKGVYSKLIWPKGFSIAGHNGYVQMESESSSGERYNALESFTNGLFKLNQSRIVNAVLSQISSIAAGNSSIKKKYQLAFLMAFLGCESFNVGIENDFKSTSNEVYKITEELLKDQKEKILNKLGANLPSLRDDKKRHMDLEESVYLSVISKLRYLMEFHNSSVTPLRKISLSNFKKYRGYTFASKNSGITDAGYSFLSGHLDESFKVDLSYLDDERIFSLPFINASLQNGTHKKLCKTPEILSLGLKIK